MPYIGIYLIDNDTSNAGSELYAKERCQPVHISFIMHFSYFYLLFTVSNFTELKIKWFVSCENIFISWLHKTRKCVFSIMISYLVNVCVVLMILNTDQISCNRFNWYWRVSWVRSCLGNKYHRSNPANYRCDWTPFSSLVCLTRCSLIQSARMCDVKGIPDLWLSKCFTHTESYWTLGSNSITVSLFISSTLWWQTPLSVVYSEDQSCYHVPYRHQDMYRYQAS